MLMPNDSQAPLPAREEDEKREQRHRRARGHVGHRLGEHLGGGEDSLLQRDAGING